MHLFTQHVELATIIRKTFGVAILTGRFEQRLEIRLQTRRIPCARESAPDVHDFLRPFVRVFDVVFNAVHRNFLPFGSVGGLRTGKSSSFPPSRRICL